MLKSLPKFSNKSKNQIRKFFLHKRKKKYFDISEKQLIPLISYIKKKYSSKKKILVAIYYPSNYEINLLKIFMNIKESKIIPLLPVVKKKFSLKFVPWKINEALIVNKYGIPEPKNIKKNFLPDIVLVPLVAFDKFKNRLGYGKGYYDRYLNSLFKLNKKIEAIGIAFSFQKFKYLPTTKYDFKLNNIFTEKGFL